MKRILLAMVLFAAPASAQAQRADPVTRLLQHLKSNKAETRSRALTELGELGPQSQAAVPVLADILAKFDENERLRAALALGKIGKASLPAVEPLLDDEDETTRYHAVWTLAHIGNDARPLAPRLLRMFAKDADEDVRLEAIHALGRIAPDSRVVFDAFASSALQKDLKTPERVALIGALRHFGKDALKPLFHALKDEDADVSSAAANSFTDLLNGNQNEAFAQAAWPFVAETLCDPYRFVSYDFPGDGVVFVLSQHGAKLLPELEKKLADKNPQTRKRALWAVSQLAANLAAHKENPDLVKKAIKLLLPAFTAPDVEMRRIVASTAPWHPDTQKAFEGLLLDEVFTDARRNLMAQNADLIPLWTKRYEAAKGDDKLRYAFVFEALEHEHAVHEFVWANLHHKDPAMRHRIACWLAADSRAEIGKTKKLFPVLLESLKSGKAEQRLQAAEALTRVRRGDRPSQPGVLDAHMPTILDRLAAESSPAVCQALLRLVSPVTEADRKRALKLTTALVDHKDADVRWAAVFNLGMLGKEGVPLLVQVLQKEQKAWILEQACDELPWHGQDAESAVPALLKLAEKTEHWQTASHALFYIAPEKSFPGLLQILTQRDELMRKTIAYPPAVCDNPTKLMDALLKDWKKGGLAQSRDIAHVLVKMQPHLSASNHDALAMRAAPLISESLKKVQKALQAADAQQRREAVAVLGLLRQLHAMQPRPDNVNGWNEFKNRRDQQLTRIDELLLQARQDSDLQVRRLARKTQATEVEPMLPGGYHPYRWLQSSPGPRPAFIPYREVAA